MITEYFVMSIRNLKKRKLRTGLTMLGIFISVATIFMLISLSLGLQNAVEEQFKILGTDKLFIIPKTGFLGPPGSVGGVVFTEKDVNTIKKVRGVADYSYVTIANAKVEFSKQTKYLMVVGLPLENTDVYTETGSWGADEGILLQEGDEGSVMLGCMFKEGGVFDKPVNIGNKLIINDERFKVRTGLKCVGNPGDDSSILMPLTDLRRLFDTPERVDQILIKVENEEDILEVADRIENKLRKSRGLTEKTQDFIVLTPEELLEGFQDILSIITVFLAGVAAISLLVGAIGISNTMYTSVLERTNEIGVMKALGAQNKDILTIFLTESGFLGLIGAGIGVILGYSVSKTIEFIAVNSLNTTLLQAAAPLYLVIGCLGFGFLIGAVSGALPAYRASRTNVVDALRYE